MTGRNDTPTTHDVGDARTGVLRAAWLLLDGDAIAAAQELAQVAQTIETFSVTEIRQLRDDRLYRNVPDDPDDRWFRSAVVVALAYRIGRAGCDAVDVSRAEQAALL